MRQIHDKLVAKLEKDIKQIIDDYCENLNCFVVSVSHDHKIYELIPIVESIKIRGNVIVAEKFILKGNTRNEDMIANIEYLENFEGQFKTYQEAEDYVKGCF